MGIDCEIHSCLQLRPTELHHFDELEVRTGSKLHQRLNWMYFTHRQTQTYSFWWKWSFKQHPEMLFQLGPIPINNSNESTTSCLLWRQPGGDEEPTKGSVSDTGRHTHPSIQNTHLQPDYRVLINRSRYSIRRYLFYLAYHRRHLFITGDHVLLFMIPSFMKKHRE